MIEYGTAQDWRWEGGFNEVRFRILVDGRPVLCRVTREYVEDNLGNPQTPEQCLDAAKAHFDQITDEVGRRASGGAFEEDGSVLLRSLG